MRLGWPTISVLQAPLPGARALVLWGPSCGLPHLVLYPVLALIMQNWSEAMAVRGGFGVQGEVEGDMNRGEFVSEF